MHHFFKKHQQNSQEENISKQKKPHSHFSLHCFNFTDKYQDFKADRTDHAEKKAEAKRRKDPYYEESLQYRHTGI